MGLAVSEDRSWPRDRLSGFGKRLQARVEGKRTEGHQHGFLRQQRQLAHEKFAAIVELVGQRAVFRRRAAAGRGDEADDQDARLRIPETRQRPRPVVFTSKAAGRVLRGLLAPRDQPRAPVAGDDFALELAEAIPQRIQLRAYFPVSFPSARVCPFMAASTSAFVAPVVSFNSVSSA